MKARFFIVALITFGVQTSFGDVVVSNTNDSGAGSLRQAVIDSGSGSIITFTNTLSGQTILLTSGQILINRNLNLDASDLLNGIIIK